MQQALVLIDIQNDYFDGGAMQLVGMEAAAENAQRLLQHFRQTDQPRIHIQHLSVRPGAGFFVPETKGVEHHSSVAPLQGETVVQKNFPNSFRDTNLMDCLKSVQAEELIICGAMSHMCVDATTRAGFDFGFSCQVIEDACATRDLEFKGATVEAAKVHASFMAALAVPYAKILSADEFQHTT
jgi:nicotinamidase-related amidase